MSLPLDLLMLAGLAAFVAYLLYDTLGTSPPSEAEQRQLKTQGNAVAERKSGRKAPATKNETLELGDSMLADGVEREAIVAGLAEIAQQDPDFTAAEFLASARAAFNLIVDGFAKGDRDLLRRLLSREVYQGFEAAIQEREREQLTSIAEIVSIERIAYRKVEVSQGSAAITLDIWSQQIRGYQQADGSLAEGDSRAVQQVGDRWTFVRVLNSQDPNWALAATDDAS